MYQGRVPLASVSVTPEIRLSPEQVKQAASVMYAKAGEALHRGQREQHDVWHEAINIMLAIGGEFSPAPCFHAVPRSR